MSAGAPRGHGKKTSACCGFGSTDDRAAGAGVSVPRQPLKGRPDTGRDPTATLRCLVARRPRPSFIRTPGSRSGHGGLRHRAPHVALTWQPAAGARRAAPPRVAVRVALGAARPPDRQLYTESAVLAAAEEQPRAGRAVGRSTARAALLTDATIARVLDLRVSAFTAGAPSHRRCWPV